MTYCPANIIACSQTQETVSYQQRRFCMFRFPACLLCPANGAIIGRKMFGKKKGVVLESVAWAMSHFSLKIRRTYQDFHCQLTQIAWAYLFPLLVWGTTWVWCCCPWQRFSSAITIWWTGGEKRTNINNQIIRCYFWFQFGLNIANCLIQLQ